MRNKTNKRGFTLIELMIVIAIIQVLASIAMPKFAELLRRSREATTKGQLGGLRSALSIYYSANDGTYPATLETLTLGSKYIDSIPAAWTNEYNYQNTVYNGS